MQDKTIFGERSPNYFSLLDKNRGRWTRLIGLFVIAVALFGWQESVSAAVIEVDDQEVGIDNNGLCSIEEAIENANDTRSGLKHEDCSAGNPNGADTIVLPENSVFVLKEPFGETQTGLPSITSRITIKGQGATIKRNIDDPDVFRLLRVAPGGNLSLQDVHLSGGTSQQGSGGSVSVEYGTLDIINCTISQSTTLSETVYTGGGAIAGIGSTISIKSSAVLDNTSGQMGGGVYAEDTSLTIINSSVMNNVAAYSGGGVFIMGGELSILRSSVSQNQASGSGYGGGIETSDTLITIIDSTIDNNIAAIGAGGIHIKSPNATIIGSTFFANSAIVGGGLLQITGKTTIINTTVSGNIAQDLGGGLFKYSGVTMIDNSTFVENLVTSANGKGGGIHNLKEKLTLSRTLVSGNSALAGPEVYVEAGPILADSYNLFGYDGKAGTYGFALGTSDIIPDSGILLSDILAPLTDNGGHTWTHALVPGSPAIDKAPDVGCSVPPISGVDQRGEPRNINGDGPYTVKECDIGSFEFVPAVPFPTPTPTGTPTSTATATPSSTATATSSVTMSATPSMTTTATATRTGTTASATATQVGSPTSAARLPFVIYQKPPTATPTRTPTSTPTQTPTQTPTSTPVPSNTPWPTPTPEPAGVWVLPHYTTFVDSIDALHVVGEVKNNTADWVEFVRISANLYSSSGQLLETDFTYTYLDKVPPGEKTCFHLIMENPAGWSYLEFERPTFWDNANNSPPITVYNVTASYIPTYGWYEILGLAKNETAERALFVSPVGTLYNASGRVIGCDYTYVNSTDLDPGQTSAFELLFSGRTYNDVGSYRIQVDADSE